ncbi:pcar [Escherichia coli]|uniref:YobI family P-loop NTPase n=1 Tax=Escherichia coli TaxID=562 RepID=UPI001C9ADF04|nr:pcar [Escherichia coli]MBY7256610.1 pcar [Escherichia coli]MBY7426867.1 pcar [Escherichia coli]MBY7531188.1 pcar [Escherichia coli]MBY7616749.1 pcar [Escherichia coli]MBY7625940.1 pcar [Escherichia coli]
MPVLSANNAQEEQINTSYDPLTPSVITDEKAQSYIEALNFACSRPDIRNIAVTGPYGAGKSSVLLTWERAEDNDFRVMTVSLADFEMQRAYPGDSQAVEGKPGYDENEKKAGKAEEKTIEYSILQQLLYKEKKSVLPYSRLERISDVSACQIAKMTASLLFILASTVTGLLFLFPDYIRAKLSLSPELSQFLLGWPVFARFGSAGIFLFTALFFALKKLHRTGVFDRRVSIDKIDILKGAISTRPVAPSLLNVYIDEIVYFFEQTQYNVVIFEDLDRHNDGAIFIKLREINQLINNCLPTDNPVRFIYAVRDNLFITPESRTKFFDFVIPVIPVMDSENASEHFLSKFTPDELRQEGFKDCLARLAIFIPDMRVMHNIANEFRLYRNIVNNGEDLKRLISLITYKNLCAEDYHRIDQKKGVLYRIVSEYISGKLREEFCNDLNNKIEKCLTEVSRLQNEQVATEYELRSEILLPYISEKTAPQLYIVTNAGVQYGFDDVIKNETSFLSLLDNQKISIKPVGYNNTITTIDKKTAQVMMDEYQERIELVQKRLNDDISRLEEIIKKNRREIQKAFSYDLSFFINNMGRAGFERYISCCSTPERHDGETFTDNAVNLDFIYFLLSHGYLSTDYMAYRSVFMPGSLSTEDNNFIRAVASGRIPDETAKMPLSNIANTVAKLHGLGILMHDNAWHPQILCYLMHNDTNSLKTIMGMQTDVGAEQRMIRLANEIFPLWEPAVQKEYIRLMVDGDGHLSSMIHQIRRLNDTAAEQTLLPLLLSLPVLTWKAVSQITREELQILIDSQFNLVTSLPESCAHFFCENLRNSGCRLNNIPLVRSDSGRETLYSVVQEKLWSYSTLNLQNICLSLSHESVYNSETFRKKPVALIKSLRIPNLETYVNENISSFIRDVFTHSEENELIPDFLNSTFVDWDDVKYLTESMRFVLDDVSVILNKENIENTEISYDKNLYSLLAHHNHIAPYWDNVITLLSEDASLSGDTFCEWLNINYSLLPNDTLPLSDVQFSQLLIKAVTSPHISKEALVVITMTFRITLINVPENIPLNNAEVLIKQKWLAPTSTVFEQLYQVLYEEGDKLTPLLYALICARPALLSANYEFVLFSDGQFDQGITRLILNGNKIADEVCISILNWLWEKDECLLSEAPLLSQQALIRFSSKITDDRQKQALMMQCLKNDRGSHKFIRQVLMTFGHQDYAAFLTDRNYRSIPRSDAMWQLAVQLGNSGFIRPPKLTHDDTRIRIEPFFNSGNEYD